MAIKPIDVRRKEFKRSFRGYNADQVDDFLDTVADEFEHTYSENFRMRDEISGLRGRLDQFEKLEGSIQSALVHAEHAANDLREGAATEAENVRNSANRDAENIRNNASREAELTIKEAQERAQQTLADSSSKVERAQESYDALKEAKQNFAADFRHLLKSYIDVMDNVDIVSTKDIEASLRERMDWEAITVARGAADERDSGDSTEEGGETQNSERPDPNTEQDEPEPEVEELEVEPPSFVDGSQATVMSDDSLATGEVENGETSLGSENEPLSSNSQNTDDEGEDNRASRASRFLRKRG